MKYSGIRRRSYREQATLSETSALVSQPARRGLAQSAAECCILKRMPWKRENQRMSMRDLEVFKRDKEGGR